MGNFRNDSQQNEMISLPNALPSSSPPLPLYRIALRLLALPKKKYHKIRNDETTQRRFACHLQDAVAHSLHLHHHQHLLLQPPFPLLTLLLPRLHLAIYQAGSQAHMRVLWPALLP